MTSVWVETAALPLRVPSRRVCYSQMGMGAAMGDQNRFFNWIWRLNAILLALLLLALAAIIASSTLTWYPKWEQPNNFAPAPNLPKEKNVSYDLNDQGKLDGTDLVAFSLQRSATQPASNAFHLSSGRGPDSEVDTVNLLIMNGNDSSSHWLFNGANRVIDPLGEQPFKAILASDVPKSPVTALVIDLRNGRRKPDASLAAEGPELLYYYRIGSDSAVEFFSSDEVRSILQIDGERLLVVYRRGNSVGAATFSTKDFKPISQSLVPPVPK
jgi:hypothetical protein